MRVGIGYDVHKLVEGRDLYLGGVKFDHDLGLLGHSDADVLTHAIMDAILGALALADIGNLFPDTDMAYKDIYSIDLLDRVVGLMEEKSYKIGNLDCVIICEYPKISPKREQIRKLIANHLKTDIGNVSIKASTSEKLGFTGRSEGIEARAVVLLEEIDDEKTNNK
ncbi:MAG: 2-C-methyl-D-erythritol 2,4-cyclodiphosphate synthase [Anaerococcus sp.]|nr:2-C-methyl-D-erythritol 2,4-cyclodiphosphate synthase [Anaerococcus sp.]